MIDISRVHVNSTPTYAVERPDHNTCYLEGVATNVMLLLKLVQDHNEACTKDNDDRKVKRVAGMMTILDDVRTRIEKSQTIHNIRAAEFRRCNTDVKRNVPRDRKTNNIEPMMDEKVKWRKELNASLAARKSLEIMCSGLGKEKEIMATELAKKVHEVNEMEELINDLKAQNENLSAKVQACVSGHKDNNNRVQLRDSTLQERNKLLSEQLLKSLDRYRSTKRRLTDAQEENVVIGSTMEEMRQEIAAGLQRIRNFKIEESTVEMKKNIAELEHMLKCFDIKVSRQD